MVNFLRDSRLLKRCRRAAAATAAVLLSLTAAQAQVDNYTFTPSQGTYTFLAGGTVIPGIAADTYISPAVPLGFNFVFDGAVYTEVRASSNGFLSFNPAATSSISTLAAATAANRPLVAPLGDDLDGRPTAGNGVGSYLTTGTAPNRVFTFEWKDWEWRWSANVAVISFQVKLYEGSNRVEFIYHPEAGATTATATLGASIGLAGTGTGAGSYLALSDASANPTASSTTENTNINTKPADGQIYAFTPAPVTGCQPIRTLTATANSFTSIQLAFTGSPNASNYTVTYTPQGGTPQTVTPAPTSSPITISGLTPLTNYTVSVTANCGGGQSSTAVTATATTYPYCTANLGGGTCSATDNINNVSIAGTTLNNANTTCNVVNGNAYTLFPATGSSTATLNAGDPYQLSVTTGNSSIVSVWIDFNGNGAFEATEWSRVVTSSTANVPSTVTIQVPPNAVQGRTGMRVRSRGTGNTNAGTDACTNFATGETEDYIVTIGPPSACPAANTLAVSNLTSTSATISFAGTASNYTVTYTAAGGSPVTVTPAPTASPINLTGLTPGTDYTVSITANCGPGQSSVPNLFTFATQIGNDECASATSLTPGQTCNPVNGSVFRATASAGVPVCAPTNGTPDDDVWYSFRATATSHDIRVTEGTGFAAIVQLFSGSCGSLSSVQCLGTTATAGVEVLQASNLTVGQLYYVRVYSSSATAPTAANSSFSICVTATATAPSNDDCAGATALTVGATCTPVQGSTWLATQSAGAPTCGLTAPGTADDDVWYSFRATSTGHDINVDELTGMDAVVQVFSGSCGTLTALQCADRSASGGAEMVRVNGLTVGDVYYVRVYSFSATAPTASNSNFTICVTPAPPAPANDDCAGAITVPVQFGTTCVSPYVATNVGASASAGAPNTTCGTYSGGDVWYRVTVPASGSLTVETGDVSSSPLRDTGITIYSGTCGSLTQVECDDDDSANGLFSKIELTGRTPGEVLYVRVWEDGNDIEGEFTLCVVAPTTCQTPVAPAANTVTSNSAVLTWSVGTQVPGANFSVEYGRRGFTLGQGTRVDNLANPTTTLSNLQADTEYCFYVIQNCGTTGSSAPAGPICFRTNPAPATNDEPCASIPLTFNGNAVVTTNGTTLGATNTTVGGIQQASCSPALSPKDVWFSMVPAAGQTSVSMVFNGNTAGMVRLFTAANCSTSFQEVNCQTSGASNTSVGRVTFNNLTPGTTYYIAVSGYGSSDNQGAFVISDAVLANTNQLPGGEVSVFPNPVTGSDLLTVQVHGAKSAEVRYELVNALGQVVLTRSAAVRNGVVEQQLPTAGLATGLYHLRLTVGQHTVVRKVMVK